MNRQTSSELNDITKDIAAIKADLKALKTLASKASKFTDYPAWLTKKQAFEILPFKSWEKLKKSVEAGVINTKQISERGDLVYSKQDCLLYPERWERHIQKMYL